MSLVMPACGCYASSRIRFTVHSRCFPLIGCLISGLDITSEILSFSSKCLYVVVLFHFEKAELALEGIRQFYVAGEIGAMKLDTFSDLHVTLRFGSSGFPCCWPRFDMRVHSRYLEMDAQGTLEYWSESNLAKKLESVNARKWMTDFEKFKLVCLFFCCVNVEGGALRVRRPLSLPFFLLLCS